MLVVSVYDKCNEIWNPPTLAHTVEGAKRGIRDGFRRQYGDYDSELVSDFQFFVIGEWDEKTGVFTAKDHVEFFISKSDSKPAA